jgi:DASS family divalent anion:Na+ symporter
MPYSSNPSPTPQQSSYSSAVFLTSGAQNLLCLDLAAKLGVTVADAWTTWFIGALPQTIVGMAACTWLLYKVYPPEVSWG